MNNSSEYSAFIGIRELNIYCCTLCLNSDSGDGLFPSLRSLSISFICFYVFCFLTALQRVYRNSQGVLCRTDKTELPAASRNPQLNIHGKTHQASYKSIKNRVVSANLAILYSFNLISFSFYEVYSNRYRRLVDSYLQSDNAGC